MKKVDIIKKIKWCLLLFYCFVFGQQENQYTQYMYNTSTLNPAYAGSRGVLNVIGTYRSQWVGIEGAPETHSFSVNSPIGVKGVGLGLSYIGDKVGATDTGFLSGDFSYTIQLSRYTYWAFGLKAGLNYFSLDVNKLNPESPQDPNLGNISRSALAVGSGLYLYSDKWYVGLSVPNLLETEYYDDVKSTSVSSKAHWYAMGGYVFDLNYRLQFKPAFLLRAVSGAPFTYDMSANFLLNEKLTLGAAYRGGRSAISALAGFQVSDGIFIGYAYDYDVTPLSAYNSGSHEILLRFELTTRLRRAICPRFF
ncbi:PorP/SprF family type IX secretion system membrane protein [Aestuariivivens insulae]|uniref:PorP/SprF family type IX secretion system membrane protein n=1 Tax=Aestuariivivens insulae TaxID=1621988 RepID=UPI001F57B5C4|nr:type IX secretion system membrane protein PorP/SprF [Aestuariivivens insulae]